jgi:peptidoglycan/LPS O-acetylase OafA/YrhL
MEKRLFFIDGLRGIAALSVAGYHFFIGTSVINSLAGVIPLWITMISYTDGLEYQFSSP